jgi:hypothetical protein
VDVSSLIGEIAVSVPAVQGHYLCVVRATGQEWRLFGFQRGYGATVDSFDQSGLPPKSHHSGRFGDERGHGLAVVSLDQSGRPAKSSTRMRQCTKLIIPKAMRLIRLASPFMVIWMRAGGRATENGGSRYFLS